MKKLRINSELKVYIVYLLDPLLCDFFADFIMKRLFLYRITKYDEIGQKSQILQFFADFIMKRLFLYSMTKYVKKYDEIGKKSQRLKFKIEVDLISALLDKLDALKKI